MGRGGGRSLGSVDVSLFFVLLLFGGGDREPQYNGRAPHGFAEESRTGTGLGHLYTRRCRDLFGSVYGGISKLSHAHI